MIMRLPASHAAADSSPRADVHGTGRAPAPGFEAALGAARGKPTVEATSPDLADADTFGTNLAGAGAPAQTPPEAPTPSLAPEALRRPAGSVPAPLPPDPAASSPAGAAAPLPPPPAPSPVVSPVRPERAVSPSDARPDDHARGAAGQQSGAEQHVASDPRMRGALVDNRAAAARALSGSDLAAQAPDDGTVGGMSTAADRRPLSWLNRHRGTSELSADGRINLKAGTSGEIGRASCRERV